MKVIIDIKDSKAEFILELLSSFKYIKTNPLTPYKAAILEGSKEAMTEVDLHKQGKIELGSARDLLDEL